MSDVSDAGLIANAEKHGGRTIILESGPYGRHSMESPIQFLSRVRAEHNAWKSRQEAATAVAARDSQLPRSEEVVTDSGPNLPFLQDAVQASQVDMEAAIEEQVHRASRELAKAEQDLIEVQNIADKLQAKINRLTRAVSNGEQFLETLRSSDVPPENAS